MKAGAFRYVRPTTLGAALDLLAHDAEAAPLAGGQSLLAMMNLRIAAPTLLVDIGALDVLRGIELQGEVVRIGALSLHREVMQSPLVRAHLPLLAAALEHVAHPAVRNRGTLGGSLALADPAAELPACVAALRAEIVVAGAGGQRRIPTDAFFTGLMQTALQPGELIAEIRVPLPATGSRWGFHELARRHGDYALAGLAAVMTHGIPRLVYFGCADHAHVATRVGELACERSSLRHEEVALLTALRADLGDVEMPGMRADTRLRLAAAVTCTVLDNLQDIPA